MEPVNYPSALLRRWPLLVGMALVGLVVAALLPLTLPHPLPRNEWKSTTIIGVLPSGQGAGGSAGAATAPLSLSQIAFYASNEHVLSSAARAAGVPASPATLRKVITFKEDSKANALSVTVEEPRIDRAVALANGYSAALTSYVAAQLASLHQHALATTSTSISSLQNQLNAVDASIAALYSADPSLARQPRANPQLGLLQARADALSAAYSAAEQSYQQLSLQPAPTSGITVLQGASSGGALLVPAHLPLLDHHKVREGVGLLVGLVVGAAIALVLESSDSRIRSTRAATLATKLPVLAEVPVDRRARSARLVVVAEPLSGAAESYRILRMAIMSQQPAPGATRALQVRDEQPEHHEPGGGAPQRAAVGALALANGGARRPARVVLVASPGLERSRAAVTANLAATFAETGQQVLVVTSNSTEAGRRGSTQGRLPPESAGAEPAPPAVAGPEDVARLLVPTRTPRVRSLSLPAAGAGPAMLSAAAPGMLLAARELADVVLVDAAPVLATHDAGALLPGVDVVVVVAEHRQTTAEQVTRAVEVLRRAGAPLLGLVLTQVRPQRSDRRIARHARRGGDDLELRLAGGPVAP